MNTYWHTYIYTNHKDGTVITIVAESIEVADNIYQAKNKDGVHPIKLNHVGCEIKFNTHSKNIDLS